MSGKQQENGGSKLGAPKLPHFPPRKSFTTSVPMSPSRRNRVDPLPGVPASPSGPGRLDSARRGRTGAEKLATVGRQYEQLNAKDTSGDVDGFDSPKQAQTRAQIARDEVRSYMQQRRQQQQSRHGYNQAPVEPHAASLDDPDDAAGDKHREVRREGSQHDPQQAASGSAGWPQFLAQQWGSRGSPLRHAAAPGLADDDVAASSADQSPTRHKQTCETPAAATAAPGHRLTRMAAANARDAVVSACRSTGDAAAIPSARDSSGGLSSDGVTAVAASGGSLTEEAYSLFKREVAARVIQAHWRRWQSWKAKLRREAEERILRQLLEDDSGLSLKLLLGNSGAAGTSSSALDDTDQGKQVDMATLPSVAAATEGGGRHREGEGVARPVASSAQRQNPVPQRARGSDAPAAASSRAGKARPASAVGPPVSPGVVVPARPRTGGPVASSQTRVQREPQRTSDRKGRSHAGYDDSCDDVGDFLDDGELHGREADRDLHKQHVQPQKKHAGGHAVYTFVVTPPPREATAAEAEEELATSDGGGAQGTPMAATSRTVIPSLPQQHVAPVAAPDAQPEAATLDAASSDRSSRRTSGAGEAQVPGSRRQTLSQQPSLDADANPAMSSPALSAITGNGGDAVERGSSGNAPAAQSPLEADSRPRPEPSRRGDLEAAMRTAMEDNPAQNDGQRQRRLPEQGSLDRPQQQRQEKRPAEQGVVPQQQASNSGQEQRVSPQLRNTDDTQGAAASATQSRLSSQPQLMPPSPQRQARMEALQRLKLQGSQRAGSSSADGSSRSVLNDVRLAADSAEGADVDRRRGGADAGQGREQQVRDLDQGQQEHRRQQRPEEPMPRQEGRDRNHSRLTSRQQLDQQQGEDRADSDRTRLKPSGLEQPTNHQPSDQPLRPRDQREELPQQDAPRYREERLDRDEREPLHAAMRAPGEARRKPHRPSAEPPSPLQRERQERFRRLMSSSEQDLRPQPSAPPPASREASEHDAAAQQRGDARPQRLPETRQQLEGYDPRRRPSRGGSDAGAAASGNESCGESDSGVAVGAPPCRVQGDHATAPRHSRPCSAAAAIGAVAESKAAIPLQRSYSVQQPRDEADDSRRHCPTDQALQPDPQRRRTTAAWSDTSAGGAPQQPLEQQHREQEPVAVGSTHRTAGGGAADRRDGTPLDPTPALTPPAGSRPDPDASRRRGEDSSQLVTRGHAAPAQGAPPAPSYQAGGKATTSVIPVDDSMTAEKMTSILKYLDEVEMQAEQEATCAAVAPALLMRETSTAAALAAALLPGTSSGVTHAHSRSHSPGSAGGGRRPATASSGRRVTSTSRIGTAATGSLHSGLQKSVAALSEAAAVGRSRPRSGHRRACSPSLADGAESGLDNDRDEDGDFDDDGAASVGGFSAASGLNGRPAFLAESVYESVRVKIRRLQDEVRQRDARVSELTQEVESLQAAQRTCLLEADARLSELLAAQRAEYEAAVSRHLAFVDRLLADKEALAGRAEQLAEQLKGAEERQERAIGKLKEGWAVELRRQKEAWAAAEKQRREAWMASKAAEIKDVTVKGLEGEVQKLLARHKAELAAAQQAAADEARRHLDSYVAQNEVAVRQLKERMARELEEAVEKERSAAATRLREVSERYEQQLQTQRMRLVADADLRLEQLEQARKEDKKRYEEAVATAKEAGETRQREAEEDWKREKEALRKAHDKQIESLREQYETGQEGWRAAMAERARKEVTERVAAIREKLLQERNEEVQAVMTRLEAEHASAAEALKEDFRKREEAAAAKAAAALKEARRAEAKMAERFRTAGAASQAAEERLAASELTVQELRRELESRSNTIRWLESQVSAAKEEAAARERDVRSLGAEKAAVAAEATAAVTREKELVEARLAQALQETQDLRSRHSAEMAAVETRVRAALARKDEVIAGLREQLAALAAELQGTQEVLRQQQEELGSVLDGGEDDDEGDVRSRRGGRY